MKAKGGGGQCEWKKEATKFIPTNIFEKRVGKGFKEMTYLVM